MFCKNCGHEINEKAFICLNCGAKLDNKPVHEAPEKSDGMTLGILAVCFALFIPLVSIICGAIGFQQARNSQNQTAKVLNLIGLIVGCIMFVLEIIIIAIVAATPPRVIYDRI